MRGNSSSTQEVENTSQQRSATDFVVFVINASEITYFNHNICAVEIWVIQTQLIAHFLNGGYVFCVFDCYGDVAHEVTIAQIRIDARKLRKLTIAL